MNEAKAKEIVDKVIGQIFGYQNPLTLDQVFQKFAFDVRLPQQVFDAGTNKPTWAQSTNPTKFITMQNAWDRQDAGGWDMPKKPLNNLQDILTAWQDINFTATERHIDSQNFAQSDNVYFSENIYRCTDVHRSKNLVFCDGTLDSEFVVAGQRSNNLSFCLRTDDSQKSSNSFNVSWSEGITNSLFIHDCKDVQDSMFCSHISGKRFCIANMQFEEAEYKKLREEVVRWILTS